MRRCFVGWRFAYPTWDSCGLPLIYPLAATETAGFPPLPVGEGRGEGNRAHPIPAARRHSPISRCFVGWRFAYPTYGPCDATPLLRQAGKASKDRIKNRQSLRHLLSSNGARRNHVNAVLHHKGQQPGLG